MSHRLEPFLWGPGDFHEAAKALAGSGGVACLELEEETLTGGRIAQQLQSAAPAVVFVGEEGVIAVERASARSALVLGPDGRSSRVPMDQISSTLVEAAAAPHVREIDGILDECALIGRRRERARQALLLERIHDAPAGKVWQVRTHPGDSFAVQMARSGLCRRMAGFAAAHLLDYGLWLLSWIVIGRAALSGRVDSGGLLAWALLLAVIVPIRLWVTWSQGVLAIGAGGLLKQRLLLGALSLDADALRAEGTGRTLGRTIEAEALENLTLSGGLAALLALLELLAAAIVLGFGAGGWIHVLLLLVWIALSFGLGYLYVLRRARWTASRLSMTHDLVERMAGHRTRLTQESPDHWHEGEDEALAQYAGDSARMDRAAATLAAVLPRGWELAAFAALLPAWVGGGPTADSIAISLGGILLAGQSMRRLTCGLSQLAGAGIAWKQVAPLFHAAEGAPIEPPPETQPAARRPQAVLEANGLVFRYRREGQPVLRDCSLRVSRGDFLLLEGGSGSGKSTLASLITGLRRPESGLLLAGGLDLDSLGAGGWRKRIAAAPQYHENHVLSASFAFNLLMGRRWPPTQADQKEAWEICQELGLGPLLERMPGGLMQMVGETGWQLSQGEKSRLYIARALLQGGDLIVLDESFAALDPENLRQALECVLRRAETLLVVAHP